MPLHKKETTLRHRIEEINRGSGFGAFGRTNGVQLNSWQSTFTVSLRLSCNSPDNDASLIPKHIL